MTFKPEASKTVRVDETEMLTENSFTSSDRNTAASELAIRTILWFNIRLSPKFTSHID